MTLEQIQAEAKKHGYKLVGERGTKTEEQWRADKEELIELRKQRDELKTNIAAISKRIHILSTSISQYEKKCIKNEQRR